MGYNSWHGKLLTISTGNVKVGDIPNVSTRPIKDCGPHCSYCRRACYALKAYRQYPAVRTAWGRNGKAFRTAAPEAVTADLRTFLTKRSPKFFRWHVAGDFISQPHVAIAIQIAGEFPGTRFLAFTKRADLDFSARPGNLTVVASMWPKMPDTFPADMPRAYMQDGTESRVPADAISCPGSCDNCGMCWDLPRLGRAVVFDLH